MRLLFLPQTLFNLLKAMLTSNHIIMGCLESTQVKYDDLTKYVCDAGDL